MEERIRDTFYNAMFDMATSAELADSRDALKWAAMTYVVAALSSLATLLYYISMVTGRD